jgi:hypothetical protein
MKIVLLWCKHCGVKYEYQASGHGCFDQKANSEYCEECNTAIIEALAPIKKKVIHKYFPCPEFGEDFNLILNDQFNWEKQCRTIMWNYINGAMYLPVKLYNPNHPFGKITVWCADGKEALVEGKFDVKTDELLMII